MEKEMEKITAKQKLLNRMVVKDRSGATQSFHDELISLGFKWKERNETMMYYAKGKDGELGLVAMRQAVMSFPRNFWVSRSASLERAMNMLPSVNRIAVDGAFSSSQYSIGQLVLIVATLPTLLRIVREVVIPEANSAGASLGSAQ
jgi:hypothetical protein